MRNNLRYIAIVGNILYIFWILYNAVDEGFRATPVHFLAYIGILLLLLLNALLLFPKR